MANDNSSGTHVSSVLSPCDLQQVFSINDKCLK